MDFRIFLIFISMALMNCKEKTKEETDDSEIRRIIHNPVTASLPAEDYRTTLKIDESVFNAGKVPQGEIIKHTFYYTNSGKYPYEIIETLSTCGCTVIENNGNTIQPGRIDSVKVTFDTKEFSGLQEKSIYLVGNTKPKESKFTVIADVFVGE
ncbi:MAG: DUF1573 domain-containing protein [Saprospiraceae bacterium]|nr:DUF1573 domain-containing protein [Saprospiraceae bacterium]